MVSEAVISVKGTTSGNVPISTAFMNQAEYKRTGLMKARQQFRYTVSIGIQKEGGSYPMYHTPYGETKSLLQVIEALRAKGFEPLQPIMDYDARREIQEFVQRQSYQYVVYGMRTMKSVLRSECEKWVRIIQAYIKGFTSPSLKRSTIKQRISKQKNHGEYYQYNGGITQPLRETDLLLDSIGYKIEELKDSFGDRDNYVTFKKQEGRGRPMLTKEEKKKRAKARDAEKAQKAAQKREAEMAQKREKDAIRKQHKKSNIVYLGSTREEIEAIKKSLNLSADFIYVDTDEGKISIPGIGFTSDEAETGHIFTREAVLNAPRYLETMKATKFPRQIRALNTLLRLSRLHILDDFLNPNKGEGK